jgi:hypothetical protein
MKRVHFDIYKKTEGIQWPGESWDYDFTEREALQKFANGTYDSETFRIVKVTIEPYKKKGKMP